MAGPARPVVISRHLHQEAERLAVLRDRPAEKNCMTEADVGNNQDGEGQKVLLRPEREFLQLPVKFRWEATRRHPYYLRFWRIASRPDPLGPMEAQSRDAARLLLQAVNVRGVPVDPALSFEELDESPVGRVPWWQPHPLHLSRMRYGARIRLGQRDVDAGRAGASGDCAAGSNGSGCLLSGPGATVEASAGRDSE